MELSNEVRKAILKELPVGCVVNYFGPSRGLNGRTLTKVADRSDKMIVVDDKGEEFLLKYFNLTCDKIRLANEVAQRLNNEDDDLPF